MIDRKPEDALATQGDIDRIYDALNEFVAIFDWHVDRICNVDTKTEQSTSTSRHLDRSGEI